MVAAAIMAISCVNNVVYGSGDNGVDAAKSRASNGDSVAEVITKNRHKATFSPIISFGRF